MSKFRLYLNALRDVIDARKQDEENNDLIKRNVLYGVKVFRELLDSASYDETVLNFEFASAIEATMGLLTPSEFMNVFPIEKDFDGHKYGVKDYFYTKEYINSLDQDKPIGEEITKLLWEYRNWEISLFAVDIMGLMSDIGKYQGKRSIAEEWADNVGLETYTMHEDHKGGKFFLDKQGRTQKITKPRAKHLKLVK